MKQKVRKESGQTQYEIIIMELCFSHENIIDKNQKNITNLFFSIRLVWRLAHNYATNITKTLLITSLKKEKPIKAY